MLNQPTSAHEPTLGSHVTAATVVQKKEKRIVSYTINTSTCLNSTHNKMYNVVSNTLLRCVIVWMFLPTLGQQIRFDGFKRKL